MVAARADADTPADVAALLDGYLKDTATGFAKAKGGSEDALWQVSMAALLRDPSRLADEIGKASRPRPPIPAGMPIGGDTGWFDNILSE